MERELRVAARRPGTYRTRVLMGGLGLALAGFVVLESAGAWVTPQQLGESVLAVLAGFVFLYCLLAGLALTADCLSREKREGTLGLLFLTDLKGYDVVLGKLAATSLNALGGVLAVLPVAAVPLLVGGVTPQQVGRVAVVELNTLLFSLAAGLLASALCRDERWAGGLCLGIVAGLTVGVPALGLGFGAWMDQQEPPWGWLLPSPGFALVMAYAATPSQAYLEWFWASVAVVHALAWALLGAACWLVPHTWQDRPAGAGPTGLPRLGKGLLGEWTDHRTGWRTRLLAINPFDWVVARHRRPAILAWSFLILSGLLWLGGYWAWGNLWLDQSTYVFTGLALHSVLKWALASEASWQLSQDRRSGVLELLLVSPLTPDQIVRGQLRALGRHFAGPVAVVVAVDVVFLLTHLRDTEWVVLWIVGLTMFLADLVTLSVLGMWLGLSRGNHTRALLTALGLVCVLPWVLFYLTVAIQEAGATPTPGFLHETGAPQVLWLGLGLAVDGLLGAWAWGNLHTRFRHIVSERPASARPAV